MRKCLRFLRERRLDAAELIAQPGAGNSRRLNHRLMQRIFVAAQIHPRIKDILLLENAHRMERELVTQRLIAIIKYILVVENLLHAFIVNDRTVYERNDRIRIDRDRTRLRQQFVDQHLPLRLVQELADIVLRMILVQNLLDLRINRLVFHAETVMRLDHAGPVALLVKVMAEILKQRYKRLVAKLERSQYTVEVARYAAAP